MELSAFSYHLPSELIAQTPAEKRDGSRLLVLNRQTGALAHRHFFDLPQILRPGDLLVLNNTKVLPVRLFGHKSTGGQVEVLLVKRLTASTDHESWQALTRPGVKVGQEITVTAPNTNTTLTLTVTELQDYTRTVTTSLAGTSLLSALDELGTLPTPPYIHDFVGDPARYQTVFASRGGSAAAPTAGLHFTPELFDKLHERGIETAELTLHVGLGTFLPVKSKKVENHTMHSEWYEMPEATAATINKAKAEGRRVIAVGTTVTRTLESIAKKFGRIQADTAETNIFLYPPAKFEVVDALITNFHLPESTLLMLVSAFVSAPQTSHQFTNFLESSVGKAYQKAIKEKYRFFSFGDAMFLE